MSPDQARDCLMLMAGVGLGIGAWTIVLLVQFNIEIRRSRKLLRQMKKGKR